MLPTTGALVANEWQYSTDGGVTWVGIPSTLQSKCPKCHGRLRVLAVITEREPIERILAHLGLPTDAPPLARARDPTDEADVDESPGQLGLGFA